MDNVENPDQELSERESRAFSRLAGLSDAIVTAPDVENALDMHPKLAREMAVTLADKGRLERVAEGEYLVLSPGESRTETSIEEQFFIASAIVEPMYVGFRTALSYHGLVDRQPSEVHVATTRNDPDREVLGVTYRVVPLIERKFFGYESTTARDHEVNVATVEKALVDCADHVRYCGGIDRLATAMAAAGDDCSWETVLEYLDRVGNGAATKRIVYLADQLGIELPGYREVVENFTKGYSPLDPTLESEGEYDHTYRLKLNVEPETFLPDSVA